MLIEFRVENHRSIRDEQVLSMEAARIGDADDGRPRAVPNHSAKLLPVAALYGANGSGKSNVLAAFAYMKEAVSLSHRLWAPDEGVPRDPFAWGERRKEASLYEVEMMIEGARYQYGFLCDDAVFLEEWLYAWPNGKKQTWFEREGDRFKFGDNLRGENKVIEGLTRPNALYLSTAAQLRHSQLSVVFSWFESTRVVNLAVNSSFRRPYPDPHRFDDGDLIASLLERFDDVTHGTTFDIGDREHVLLLFGIKAFLQWLDVGIVDLRLNREDASSPRKAGRAPRFELKHEIETEDAWLPLEEESRGTKMLFRLALPVLRAIRDGTVLFIDELEASIHPMIADDIVRYFNDPQYNRRNAQLIFSTHDTNLLGTLVGEPALRRDQVWMTEKDPRGGTVLYPLTDFKPRKEENIERGYIQGRYGAVPFLGAFRVPSGDGA